MACGDRQSENSRAIAQTRSPARTSPFPNAPKKFTPEVQMPSSTPTPSSRHCERSIPAFVYPGHRARCDDKQKAEFVRLQQESLTP
jgi:hypothetical protein